MTGSFVIANEQNQPRDLGCGLGALGATSSGDDFAFAVDLARLRLEPGDQDAVAMLGGTGRSVVAVSSGRWRRR